MKTFVYLYTTYDTVRVHVVKAKNRKKANKIMRSYNKLFKAKDYTICECKTVGEDVEGFILQTSHVI